MLTKRDHEIIRFIEDFNLANTSNIKDMFFPKAQLQSCQKRLAKLYKQGHIKRDRGNINADYMYYLGKRPQQIEHSAMRLDFFMKAYRTFDIYEFQTEYIIDNIKSDAYFELEYKGKDYGLFLEVQLSNGFDQDKYEKLYFSGKWREHWDTFPCIIVLTNRNIKIKQSSLKFIIMDTDNMDMNLIKNVLK
jgi:hypothetical protein